MMKKAIVLVLLAAFFVPAFADDAITLPQGVMRTRVIPSMTIVNKVFDDDGDREDNVIGLGEIDSLQIYNLSFALEYGITDWLTAGLQWTPGWRLASNFDFEANQLWQLLGMQKENEKISSTGINDLFVGAKIQVVGDRGLVPDPTIRFAVTPGIKIPLSQYDAKSESENFLDGKAFQPSRIDRGAWGLGGRLAFDYVINPQFYINLFNETVLYLPVDQQQFNPAAAAGSAAPGVSFGDIEEELEIKYGAELTFEVEPAYSMDIGNGVQMGLGLPITYKRTGETEIDGKGADDDAWTLSVGPNVSFFFTQWTLPMEFEVGFSTPLAGKNSPVANTLTLQIKNFFRF